MAPFYKKSTGASSASEEVPAKERSTGENYLDELVHPREPTVEFVPVFFWNEICWADTSFDSASLVAVHGLNPGWNQTHGQDTWTKNNVLWLQHPEFLPKALPHARIMLYGYNAKVAFDTTTQGLMDIARDLLNRLKVVRKALNRARNSTAYEPIQRMTRGIAFFGTPHRGGNHADLGSIIASIVRAITGNVKNSFMQTLQKDSTIAQDIQEIFEQQAQDYQIVSFYETKPFNKNLGLIVDKASAKLGLSDSVEILVGVAENHSNICKFDDSHDGNYKLVIGEIIELVQAAIRDPSRLSVPSISVKQAPRSERSQSAASFRSDDSLSESSTRPQRVRFRMPTWSNTDLNSSSSGEITRVNSRESWDSQPPEFPVVIMPYNENPHFVGRDEVLENIKGSLQSKGRDRRRVALCGLGGVGKSQIAINYTFWYHRTFPGHSLFWIHGGTAESFRQGLLEIGTKCRIPGPNDPIDDRLALIRDWLQHGNVHPWLMIIDNADDPAIFSRSNDASTIGVDVGLERYIPDCDHGRILVTTRDLKAGRSLAKGNAPIRIERTTTVESIKLLRNELGEAIGGRQWRDDDAARLATVLDHLPLAMVSAASFIKENSMTLASYMKLIEEDSMAIRLLKYNFEEGERGRDPERPNAVYATWKLSIDQIKGTNPNAAILLFVMAFLEQSNIPASLLKPLIGEPIDFTTAVGALLRFSLIGSGSEDSYNMHRLMQLTVRCWLDLTKMEDPVLRKALLLLSDIFPVGGRETFDMCLAFEPHAVKVLRAASTLDDVISARAKLQTNLSWYYLKSIRWTEAEAMARDACQSLEKAYSGKHKQTLQAKANLARILNEEGKYEEAEIVSRQVVDGTKSLLGTKDNQTLEAYHFMAKVYQLEGKLSQAEKAARKALSGREKTLEPTNPDVYRSQRRLATILELQGKYGAAEALINKALEGQRVLAGPSDEKTLHIQYRLAFIQRAQGHYAAAEDLVREAFAIQTSVYGLSSLGTRKMQYSLALSLIAQSKIPEAETHILDLLRFVNDQHRVGPDHRYRLHLQFALGLIKTAQGCHAEAVSLYRMAWEGIERSSPGHPESLEFHSAYAAALLELDVAAHAEESYSTQNNIHKASEKEIGPDHPITLTSLLRLSEASAAKGDVKRAVKVAKRARERREKVLGNKHPDTVAAEAWLEQLQARGKSKVNVAADVVEDVGTTRDRGKSLGEEANKDRGRGFLGRWRRSSSGKTQVDDSVEDLPGVDKEGGIGSENSDDDSYDGLADEKEGAMAPDTDKSATTAFAIRRREVGT